ncbi:MAG: ABC transporter permease [Magnetococcales bacterium]|nr:ABC transporter permease [Magnetococcales bacterium]NGZ25248.1 ABC transporter permease [Magnetococcales bacterium]
MKRVIFSLASREWIRFFRQPHRVVGSVAQPMLFWLLLGSGFAAPFTTPGGGQVSYLEYFYPGILLMMMLFSSIFATITIIEDRNQGLLQEVLVAPVSPMAVVLGKVLGAMAIALAQGLLLLFAAPLLGLPLGSNLPFLLVGMILSSLGFTTIGFFIAWRMESTAGFHAIMSVFLMPLWMLSGALFPLDGAPGWLYAIMIVNPATHALRLIRMPFYLSVDQLLANPDFILSLVVAALWAVVCLVVAMHQVSRQERGEALPPC